MESEKKELELYLNDLIDEYFKRNCPRWVNYDMFKQEKYDNLKKFFEYDETNDPYGFDMFGFLMELYLGFECEYFDPGISDISIYFEHEENYFKFPKRIQQITCNLTGNLIQDRFVAADEVVDEVD